MDEIQFDDEIMFDDEISPPAELNVYSIRKKDGGRLGEVSATSESDAMDQAEGMGFTRGTYSVVRKYDKPTTVKGREELLIKRGMSPKEASTMAKVAPYASSDVYDKPLSEVSLMSGAAQRDVFSLPGRFLASRLGGTNEGEDQWTSMGRTDEDEGTNFGGSIVRAPSTGVATLLAPLSAMGVGATGLTSPWLVGALEGGSIGAGTSAFNYATDEDYTIADAVIETFLSAGIGSLIKGGSAKSIEKAKNMIRSSGNFTQKQIDYIYNKLGITRGGTEQKLSKSVPERIGDIANIEYGDINPITGVRSTYVAEDIAGNIPKDVAKAYQESIKMGRIHSGMNIEQKRAKELILKEFNESMDELASTDYEEAGRYLDRLLEEAKYFYQKDPELGQIMLNKIEEVYNLNYALMENAPMNIKLAPMSDLTSKFGEVSATSQYLRTQPKPVKVFESGGVGGFGTLAPNMTPERLSNVGGALQALRMPSIVSTQDVLSNTSVPEYLNLNELK